MRFRGRCFCDGIELVANAMGSSFCHIETCQILHSVIHVMCISIAMEKGFNDFIEEEQLPSFWRSQARNLFWYFQTCK